jgi:hypothetical protein
MWNKMGFLLSRATNSIIQKTYNSAAAAPAEAGSLTARHYTLVSLFNRLFRSSYYMCLKAMGVCYNERSEQARAPHTNEPRDEPRCGALSLL